MASYTERLAYLITANGDEAVRSFQKVGKSAETELGKASTGADRFGATLTKVGAGMVAFAGVAAAGLDHFARQAEASEHAQLLLNNTLANSPQLAGQSAKQFDDLATSIQNKTAADNKAIVAGIATLGNFNLTAAQLKTLTPLMVDYAARTGKEVPDAASDLGKALLGNSRALKAIGVDFHNTGDATGNFNEIVQALRDKVGGFAEQEGKTFSGSIARLKNQLNDLEAGVGKGVVDAFTSAVKPVAAFSQYLSHTSPAAQELTGRLLAISTGGIAAVGGLSLIAGQLVKLRTRFVETEGAAAGTLTTLGKFGVGVAGLAGLAGVAVTLAEINKQSNQLTVNIGEVARATNDQLVEAFKTLQDTPFGGHQRAIDAFTKTAEQGIGTARRWRDALAAAGVDVSKLDKILADETAAQRRANTDTQAAAGAIDDMGNSATSATTSTDSLASSLSDLKDAAFGVQNAEDAVTSSMFGLVDEAKAAAQAQQDAVARQKESAQSLADTEEQVAQRISDAQDQVTAARDDAAKINKPGQQRDEAAKRVADAEKNLARTRREGDRDITKARQDLAKATQDVADATDRWTPSLDAANESGIKNRKTMGEIVTNAFNAAEQLREQGAPASAVAGYLDTQEQLLKTIGDRLGFNKQQLKEYLDLLSSAGGASMADAAAAAFGYPASASALAQQAAIDKGGTVLTVNVTANSPTADEIAAEVAKQVDRALRRRG